MGLKVGKTRGILLVCLFAAMLVPTVAFASVTYYQGPYQDTGSHFSDIKYGYRTSFSRDNTSLQVVGLGYAKPVTRQVNAGAIKLYTSLQRRTSSTGAWQFAGEAWASHTNPLPAGTSINTHAASSLVGTGTYAAKTTNEFRNPNTLLHETFMGSYAYTF